jgi:phosphoglycerate dehydrogenase-like enzyme
MPHAPAVRWVHTTAARFNHLLSPGFLAVSPMLTRTPVFSHVVAWHALALALALKRRLPELVQAQADGRWAKPPAMLPLPRAALVLGLGRIGQEIARLLKGLGLFVYGCAAHASKEKTAACDAFLGPDEWRDCLPKIDMCFLALPGGPGTEKIFDVETIGRMPVHALLVNVGHESCVDVAAVCRALESARLGGAAFDTLDPIPASDDALWRTPGLLITPKVSVFHPARQSELEAYVEDQVARYLAGQPLLNQVDYCEEKT